MMESKSTIDAIPSKEVSKDDFYTVINPLRYVDHRCIVDGSKARNFLHYGPIIGASFSVNGKIIGHTRNSITGAVANYYLPI